MEGNTHDRVMISSDSILLVINEMVRNVPSLKFLPNFVSFTFSALLKTDPQKAYGFAREVIATPSYSDEPSYGVLMSQIEENSDDIQISKNIYRLGAECCQALIDKDPYPEFGRIPENYKRMAKFYRLAGDIQKATEAEQKGENFLLMNNKH